jgi:hypothetical protein
MLYLVDSNNFFFIQSFFFPLLEAAIISMIISKIIAPNSKSIVLMPKENIVVLGGPGVVGGLFPSLPPFPPPPPLPKVVLDALTPVVDHSPHSSQDQAR